MNTEVPDRRKPRPRALLVTRNLPPLTGGMERLNWHLAAQLTGSLEVSVCGPEGCAAVLPTGTRAAASFPSAPTWRFLIASFLRCQAAARRVRPALLIAGSGVTAPHIWVAAHQVRAKTLVYLHGLDLVTRNPVYRTLFLPCVRRCDRVLVNSANTARLALTRGIAGHKIHILNPGVELPAATEHIDTAAFRGRFGIGNRPVLLTVGRLTARKGLIEFVRHALPAVVTAHPATLLLVVGAAADAQLGGASRAIREAAAREADRLGLADNLRFTGRVDDGTLAQAYCASQLHVFPVLDLPDDVEGFGMVALEAAAYGLPTFGFRVGGVPDAIADGHSGMLFRSGDYPAMAQSINLFLAGALPQVSPEGCRAFARPRTWEQFGEQLRHHCDRTLEGSP